MSVVNIITYNQLMKMFSDFSDAHYQINDFGVGPTSEIGTSRQMAFPYMWVTHRTPSEINVTNKTQIPQLKMSVLFVDQIADTENIPNDNGSNSNNEQEVLSDTFQYLQDFVGYVSSSLGAYGVQLTEDSVTAEPIYDETQDKVSGWLGDITVNLRHSNCTYPMSGVTFSSSTSGQPLILPNTDTYVTGGTYNAGTTIFTNNDGDTFNVTGYTSGGGGASLWSAGTASTPADNGILMPNATYPNTATGKHALAAGASTDATGDYSTSFGGFNTSSGNKSFTVGQLNIASGEDSSAMGQRTTANGIGSHSFGVDTFANGSGSYAGGRGFSDDYQIKAWGDAAFAHFGITSHIGGTNTFGAYADNSAILGGTDNTVPTGMTRSVVLGGDNIVALSADTVYVPQIETAILGEGIIMTSPNGTRYKTTVDNSGNLVTVLA